MSTLTQESGNSVASATSQSRLPAPAAGKAVRVVEDHGPLAHLMDTARFEHLQRIAGVMAGASLVPDHLRGKSNAETLGNCFLVVNQALRWGLDPFAVAAETYSVGGKLGFQGKLIAALVNARANLVGRLRYEFRGKGDDRTVTVIGRFADEDMERTVDLSVSQAKTANKMWTTDPDQKLIYSAATKWARRHCAEVLLGVLTDDDLERISENRQIASGPATMVDTLDDLAARLNQAAAPATEAQALPAPTDLQPAESPAAAESSQASAAPDWPAVTAGFRETLRGVHSVLQATDAAKALVAAHADMPEEEVARVNALRDVRITEIRADRGEATNAKS